MPARRSQADERQKSSHIETRETAYIVKWDLKSFLVGISLALLVNRVLLYGQSSWHMAYGRIQEAIQRRSLEQRWAAMEGVALEDLQMLRWLANNDAAGVGPPDAVLALRRNLGECGCRQGIVALKEIGANTLLLSLPLHTVLRDSPNLSPRFVAGDDVPWSVALAAAALRERAKGSESFFRPYLEALPVDVPGCMAWSVDDIRQIDYLPVRTVCLEERQEAILWHTDFRTYDPDYIGHADQDSFIGMLAIAHTHAFPLKLAPSLGQPAAPPLPRGEQGEPQQLRQEEAYKYRAGEREEPLLRWARGKVLGDPGLVPIADVFSHHQSTAQVAFRTNASHFQAWSLQSVRPGEEMYGHHGLRFSQARGHEAMITPPVGLEADELLLRYGAVSRGNHLDHYEVLGTVEEAVDWLIERYGAHVIAALQQEEAAEEADRLAELAVNERLGHDKSLAGLVRERPVGHGPLIEEGGEMVNADKGPGGGKTEERQLVDTKTGAISPAELGRGQGRIGRSRSQEGGDESRRDLNDVGEGEEAGMVLKILATVVEGEQEVAHGLRERGGGGGEGGSRDMGVELGCTGAGDVLQHNADPPPNAKSPYSAEPPLYMQLGADQLVRTDGDEGVGARGQQLGCGPMSPGVLPEQAGRTDAVSNRTGVGGDGAAADRDMDGGGETREVGATDLQAPKEENGLDAGRRMEIDEDKDMGAHDLQAAAVGLNIPKAGVDIGGYNASSALGGMEEAREGRELVAGDEGAERQGSKARQVEAGGNARQEEAVGNARQEEAGGNERQEEAGASARQEKAGDNAKQMEARDNARQEEAGDKEEAGGSARHEEAGGSARHEEAGGNARRDIVKGNHGDRSSSRVDVREGLGGTLPAKAAVTAETRHTMEREARAQRIVTLKAQLADIRARALEAAHLTESLGHYSNRPGGSLSSVRVLQGGLVDGRLLNAFSTALGHPLLRCPGSLLRHSRGRVPRERGAGSGKNPPRGVVAGSSWSKITGVCLDMRGRTGLHSSETFRVPAGCNVAFHEGDEREDVVARRLVAEVLAGQSHPITDDLKRLQELSLVGVGEEDRDAALARLRTVLEFNVEKKWILWQAVCGNDVPVVAGEMAEEEEEEGTGFQVGGEGGAERPLEFKDGEGGEEKLQEYDDSEGGEEKPQEYDDSEGGEEKPQEYDGGEGCEVRPQEYDDGGSQGAADLEDREGSKSIDEDHDDAGQEYDLEYGDL